MRADSVIDTVGGKTQEQLFTLVKPGGIIVRNSLGWILSASRDACRRPFESRHGERQCPLKAKSSGRKSGAAKIDLLSTPSSAVVCNPRPARSSPSNSATSYNSATPDDGAATINAATIVGAAAAILIVRIAIAAGIITAATGHNCTPSHDRSPAINATTPNCNASPHADATATPVNDLHNPTVVA
jgi:hypothetical protein